MFLNFFALLNVFLWGYVFDDFLLDQANPEDEYFPSPSDFLAKGEDFFRNFDLVSHKKANI